ncbi:MAG: tyrosinase family protein [Gemmatimonadaceae bacterium]
MGDMDRRDFMIAALGGAGLLGASGLLGTSSALASILPEATATVYTRRNVYCLNAYSREIVAYKAAINAMRALPDTNGISWMAQANIHGATAPPAGMITDVCEHGQLFFLSWHRMYVYFFERIVRKMSGDANFALPYWGYSPTGARNLPAFFRSPATANNPLYTSNRNASINAGNPITASLVDAGGALAQTAFFDFTNSVNSIPHGQVHVAVGGGMSSFEEAGRDPIFWLHHCNIDRLWELWLASGGGRANPTTNTTWMTTSFSFYDENGATVSLTGAQIVDTACQLRYQYESDVCGRVIVFDPRWWRRFSRIPIPPEMLIARLDSLGTRPPRPDPLPLAQAPETVRLGGQAVNVALPFSAEGKRILAALPRDAQVGGQITLVFENIQVEGTPRVAYEIYVNLPADVRSPAYTSPHYVGNVNLFGPSPRGPHAAKRENQIVPLSLAYLRLREAKHWSDDAVRVTFIPRSLTEGQDPARTLGQRTQVTIGRMSVQVQ